MGLNLKKTIAKMSIKKLGRKDSIINEQSSFAVIEAFKNLRTNLNFVVPKKQDGSASSIVVTSSLPLDGKTTIAVNLAVTLSMADVKVLIIDADMRKPRVNRFFEQDPKMGLSTYLSGRATIEEVTQKTSYQNLFAIFSGEVPPNPAELLSSARMQELLEAVSKQYDYIILDVPPLEVVSDCLTVTPYVDGVLLVVKALVSTHPLLQKTMGKLEFAKAKILGIVLNDYEVKQSKGYKYKYKYRSRYYGKDDE